MEARATTNPVFAAIGAALQQNTESMRVIAEAIKALQEHDEAQAANLAGLTERVSQLEANQHRQIVVSLVDAEDQKKEAALRAEIKGNAFDKMVKNIERTYTSCDSLCDWFNTMLYTIAAKRGICYGTAKAYTYNAFDKAIGSKGIEKKGLSSYAKCKPRAELIMPNAELRPILIRTVLDMLEQ